MSEVTVADLIGNAADQSPEAFRATFDQLMHDKIVDALETKKQEVAANYFNAASGEKELETDNEDQNGEDAETNS